MKVKKLPPGCLMDIRKLVHYGFYTGGSKSACKKGGKRVVTKDNAFIWDDSFITGFDHVDQQHHGWRICSMN